MSDRQSEIEARIASLSKLRSVVRAMRGIAANRSRLALEKLRAAEGNAAIHRAAWADLTALLPTDLPLPADEAPPLLLVFLAEQGFAGSYSEHLLEALSDLPDLSDRGGGADLILLGQRGTALARERGLRPVHTAGLPASIGAVPRFATALQTLLLLRRPLRISALVADAGAAVAAGAGAEAEAGAGGEAGPTSGPELIYPPAISPRRAKAAQAPLLNLPAEALLAPLAGEVLHAELCRLTLAALAAENAARMRAMAAAEQQSARMLDTLQIEARLARQEGITTEILEIAAASSAAVTRR